MKRQSSDPHLLAAQYALGVPHRCHRRPISLLQTLALLTGSLLSFGGAGLLVVVFLSAGSLAPVRLFACVLALLVGILLLLIGWSRLKYRRYQAWECEEGFLELDERGAVSAALRRDHIQAVWHRVKVVSTSLGGPSYFHTYGVQGLSGKEVTLNYPDLWQRIEYEFVRLHLSESLATIHAGGTVPFGSVVVSVQGIASGPVTSYLRPGRPIPAPPWQLAWQALPWIIAHDSGLEFPHPAGSWDSQRRFLPGSPIFPTSACSRHWCIR